MNKSFLQIAVFICGASVMIIEIVGSRLVAPYLGGSLIVWTTLIGVILAALSLGYWLGGRLADARPSSALFGALISFSALFVAAMLWLSLIIRPLAFSLIHLFGLPLATLSLTILLFALPSIILGMVTPYALRLAFQKKDQLGQTAGSLYALSTVGSIVGTFSAGFFFIPILGSFKTLILISLLLALTGLLFFRKIIFIILFFIIIATAALVFAKPRIFQPYPNTLTDQESAYNRLFIVSSIDRETNRPILSVMSGPRGVQSARFADIDDDLVFEYTKFFRLVDYFKPDLSKTLMIGGGAYSIPTDYLKRQATATMDVVEIDPLYTKLAQDYFNLQTDQRLKIYHEDARLFLNDNPRGYDAIFIDVFNGSGSVPFQLTTREAINEVNRALNDQGVVIVNLIGSLSGPGEKFISSEYATYRSSFNDVRLFPLGNAPNEPQNFILIALKGMTWPTTIIPEEYQPFLSLEYKGNINNGKILTDDWAPVDYFLAGVL